MSSAKAPYITTTHGMSGFFAVKVWWNPDGFWEPWDTGFGRFTNQAEAIEEAKAWAAEENLEYHEAPQGPILSRTALNPKAAWPFPKGSRG